MLFIEHTRDPIPGIILNMGKRVHKFLQASRFDDKARPHLKMMFTGVYVAWITLVTMIIVLIAVISPLKIHGHFIIVR